MSEIKYRFKRDGSHVTLLPKEEVKSYEKSIEKSVNISIWSKIKSFFEVMIAGLIMVISFLIATPFVILNLLGNWVKISIGFALFWFIVDLVYIVVILDGNNFEPFTNTSIPAIMVLGLIAAVFVTISEIKE